MNSIFTSVAQFASHQSGRSHTFFLACLAVVIWALTGPYFNYSDTWQLVINTSTTIVTFLMVFLLQNTQNRDNLAMQIKIDELIRVNRRARNTLIDLDQTAEADLETILQELKTHRNDENRHKHTHVPKPVNPQNNTGL